MASGRSKIVAVAPGTARRKASVHVPEAPPTSSRWRNFGGPSCATSPSAIGPEIAVHGGDEGSRDRPPRRECSPAAARGTPLLNRPRQLRPAAHDVRGVPQHGQDGSAARRRSASRATPAARGNDPSRFSSSSSATTASNSIVERAQIAVKFLGQLLGRQRLLAERGPHVEFRRGPDHAGRAKAVHHLKDLQTIWQFRHGSDPRYALLTLRVKLWRRSGLTRSVRSTMTRSRELHLFRVDPGHELPQAAAHFLDLVRTLLPPQGLEGGRIRLVFQNPFAGPRPLFPLPRYFRYPMPDDLVLGHRVPNLPAVSQTQALTKH